MTEQDYSALTEDGREIIEDLMKIIPSWRDVDLTRKGYSEQYVKTLIDVAIYVVKREQYALEKLHNDPM